MDTSLMAASTAPFSVIPLALDGASCPVTDDKINCDCHTSSGPAAASPSTTAAVAPLLTSSPLPPGGPDWHCGPPTVLHVSRVS